MIDDIKAIIDKNLQEIKAKNKTLTDDEIAEYESILNNVPLEEFDK